MNNYDNSPMRNLDAENILADTQGFQFESSTIEWFPSHPCKAAKMPQSCWNFDDFFVDLLIRDEKQQTDDS